MNKTQVLITYRCAFAVLALVAVLAQLRHGLQYTNMSVGNFFSYFTIESNILALAVFIVAAKAAYTKKTSRSLDYLRGAATLYMTITGVIYSLLLSGIDVDVPLPWVNLVLHYVFPLAVVVDWLIDRPSVTVTYKKALFWLAFPLAYFVYSLIRGHFVGWYPYPFMNALQLGYAKVAVNAVVIAIGMVLLALAIAWLGRNGQSAKKK